MNPYKNFLPTKALVLPAIFLVLLPFNNIWAQAKKPAGKTATSKPATLNKPAAKNPTVNKPSVNNNAGNRSTNVNNSGNTTNNIGGNNKRTNINNSTNNSNNNVNINIDNSKDIRINNNRNTVVRPNYRPYPRPPYMYGGFHYRCYNPYFFHPYQPFMWGPAWHPWGFFITTLAVTAILISVDNIEPPANLDVAMGPVLVNEPWYYESQAAPHGPSMASYPEIPAFTYTPYYPVVEVVDGEYWYDQGVFYIKADGGYTVVSAPVGAKIKTLPTGYETITLDDNTKNYYYGGAFYEKTSAGYTVVAPLAGSVVTNVSQGGEEVKLGDITYVKFGETYFQPIKIDGKNKYEVVDVQEAK